MGKAALLLLNELQVFTKAVVSFAKLGPAVRGRYGQTSDDLAASVEAVVRRALGVEVGLRVRLDSVSAVSLLCLAASRRLFSTCRSVSALLSSLETVVDRP